MNKDRSDTGLLPWNSDYRKRLPIRLPTVSQDRKSTCKGGGEVILRNDKRFVEVKDDVAIVTMEKQPNQIYPFSLQTSMPADAKKDQQFAIRVSQRDQNGTVVGGATVIYMIK